MVRTVCTIMYNYSIIIYRGFFNLQVAQCCLCKKSETAPLQFKKMELNLVSVHSGFYRVVCKFVLSVVILIQCHVFCRVMVERWKVVLYAVAVSVKRCIS